MQCGLLGRTLGHSYSPEIHRQLGPYDYRLYEVEPDQLEHFLSTEPFSGLNVTIPYKKAVIPFLSELTAEARALGAVNTIVRRNDGSLLGHNTDLFGFTSMLRRTGLSVRGKKALVLGSGGASSTAAAVLKREGAETVVISRRGENNYENLSRHADASLIVNATPVGMYPHAGASALELTGFPHLEGVLDLIYNPARTKLLMDGEALGLRTENGLWMLVSQAWESAQWFLGKPLPEERIAPIYRSLRRQTENLILIGMPGSGKSTVGSILADGLGRKFVDIDREIEKTWGPIGEIFARRGEAGFRELESRVLSEAAGQSSLVIATGGGCVTVPGNYALLHQNGRIFCLRRPLGELSTAGRPLSEALGVEALYEKRKPLYEAFADDSVDNSGSPRQTAGEILKRWEESI